MIALTKYDTKQTYKKNEELKNWSILETKLHVHVCNKMLIQLICHM